MPRLLILFSLCNLVIGTGAFVVSAILEPIGQGLGVSVPAAGQAMTAYAMATALLAPILMVATGHWRRKNAMLLAMLLFTAGNAVCALAPNLTTLLLGRVLMGIGSGFSPLAAGITVALVAPSLRGKALALVFLGMSLSYALGVPLGAWLGFTYGWHAPMAASALASLAMVALLAWKVPRDINAPGTSFKGLSGLLTQGPALRVLGLTLLYFVAIFCTMAYIGPVLRALQPMSSATLALVLAMFGVSGAVGTAIGGYATDRFGTRTALVAMLSTLGATMALLPLTQGSLFAVVAALLVWGCAGFGMMAPQQARLAALAPAQAPLLFSLNTSMLYIGTAVGAAVGGAAVGHVGFALLPWVGVPFALLGLSSLAWGRGKDSGPLAAATHG